MNDLANQLPAIDASSALQSFIAFWIVLACAVTCGFAGYRMKLFSAIIAFGVLITSSIAAFVWGELCGRVMGVVGFPDDWRLVGGFVGVLLVSFVLLTMVFRFAVRADVMTYPKILDRTGGLLVGLLGGLVLASILRVGLAMTPVTAGARPTPEQLQADITPRVLQMLSRIISGDPAVRRMWLRGAEGPSPPDGQAEPGTIVVGEPFVDGNDNGLRDRDEPFLDKDGDGRFTGALTTVDESLSPDLYVGVIERYWLGNWDRVRVEAE